MEKAITLFESISPTFGEIKKECTKYLKKVLNKAKNNRIEFFNEEGESIINEFVSVPYDGGNHPDYASNAFSTVYSVFLNESGDICLRTEDCDEYGIENVNWDNLYDVSMHVFNVLKALAEIKVGDKVRAKGAFAESWQKMEYLNEWIVDTVKKQRGFYPTLYICHCADNKGGEFFFSENQIEKC